MKETKDQTQFQNQIKEKLNLQDLQKQNLSLNPSKKEQIEVDKDYLDKIHKIRAYSSEQLDKQIVYLAGGGLVFTVGFIKHIVDFAKVSDPSMIIIAWVLFVVTLVLNLLSHKTSLYSMDLEIQQKHKKSDDWDSITEQLNWISIITLILAIASFIIFVSINI